MKKQRKKNYFSGGEISMLMDYATKLSGDFVNAAQYEFNPNGPAYKADWSKAYTSGLVGMIPELIKASKDKKGRSAYVASATPGNYQQGGPIQPTPVLVSRGSRPSHYLPNMGVAPTPQINVMDQLMIPGLMPTPVQLPGYVKPLMINEAVGGSSKSKSRDRFRERDSGGPLVPTTAQSEYTMYSKDKAKGSDSSGRKTLRRGMREEAPGEITQLQQFLRNQGYYKGNTDGIYGPQTEAAVKAYQKNFNKEAEYAMSYAKDSKKSELIGKGGKKIKEDGIVGDQTRTALMYRERSKPTNDKKVESPTPEFPMGERLVKYQTSDYTPNNFPDSPMNYAGGLEMLGLAMMVPEATGIGTAMATRGAATVGAEVTSNMLSQGVSKLNLPEQVNFLGNTVKNTVGRTGGRSFAPKTPSSYGTRIGYASGGQMPDEMLSNSAFQVKGAPNVTDGNSYPELNANLDHNEVVKKNFVYSTKLKAPNGKPFSFEAAKIENSTGKAQKKLMTNPQDESAKNTIKMNESAMQSLATLQETIATAKGLRKPTRDFAYGGYADDPTDPPYTFIGETNNNKLPIANISPTQWLDITNPFNPATGKRRRPIGPDTFIGSRLGAGQAAIDLGRDGLFYDPYSKKFTVRNSKGEYVGVQPNAGQFEVNGSNIRDLTNNRSYNVDEHLRFMSSPKIESSGAPGPRLETPSNVLTNTPEDPSLGAFPRPVVAPPIAPAPVISPVAINKRRGPGAAKASKTNPTAPPPAPGEIANDISTYEQMLASANAGDLPLYRGEFDSGVGTGPVTQPVTSTAPARALPNIASAATFGQNSTNSVTSPLAGLGSQFTIGDGLQALTVASKFGQLAGGAEVEKPYYDTTNITKENFDPSNPLYQANRNFQQGLNTLQNSSINQNRSFLNNLYVGKLNQDSDILTKYNQMNQSARTQQEARQSDQRRYNIGQTVGTNDINARNRAAYKEAVDVASNSLGNFGKGLNEKKIAYDSLAVLQKMYPDVYARIMAEQQKTKSTNAG